jgi:hypothetical protein
MKTRTLSALVVLSAAPIVAVLAQAPQPPDTSDHQAMLDLLHITTPLRQGPAGRLDADGKAPANYANYDESKATATSPVPQLLVMNDGRKITTRAMWEQHRKELFEIFDREFYGRLPEAAKTIKVTWEVTGTTQGMSGTIPTVTRTLVGHVDPTYYPAIKVDIAAAVTTPANAAGKVPVIIQFGGLPGAGRAGALRAGGAPGALPEAVPRVARVRRRQLVSTRRSRTARRHGSRRRSRSAGATAFSCPAASRPTRATTTRSGRASSASSTRASRARWTTGGRSARGRGARAS